MRAGKHVLCEKPVAVNTAESEQMFDVAEKAGLVLAETFMYRSHPLTLAVLDQVRKGTIGQLRLIRTSFCYATRRIEGNVRFSMELAGGALMDIGCYCVHLARIAAGCEPIRVQVVVQLHESGVDQRAAGILQFPKGLMATFACGMDTHTDNSAVFSGTEGYIHVPIPWKPLVHGAQFIVARMTPPRMDRNLAQTGPSRQVFHVDADRPLYALEADDFVAAVQDGISPAVSREETLGNMRVLDDLRKQGGLMF